MAKRKDEIDAAIAAFCKDQGDEFAMARMGDMQAINVESLPSGIFSLDQALGVGGFPKGRIIEIFGPASHGKTGVMLHTIAETQAGGGQAAFIDAEHSFDPVWADALGVDVPRLVFMQPPNGETALDAVEKLVEAGIDLVVVDSVEGLVPRAEIDGEMGEALMGLKARLMGQACRKLAGLVSKSGTCLAFINQIREKIGGYGNPEVTPGGKALLFWSSVRVEIRRTEYIDEGETKKVGIHVRAKVVKSKVAAPFREAEFDLYSGICRCHARGVDKAGDLLDFAEKVGAVEKSGTWFAFEGERLGQGRINAAKEILGNPEFSQRIRQKILDSMVEGKAQERAV